MEGYTENQTKEVHTRVRIQVKIKNVLANHI